MANKEDDIVVTDNGETYETQESTMAAKQYAEEAKLQADRSELNADRAEEAAIEARGSKDAAEASATAAATSASSASSSEAEAKRWAIGAPSEPVGNSAKYWAGQAEGIALTVGLQSRLRSCILSAPNGVFDEVKPTSGVAGTATVFAGLKVLLTNGLNADGTHNNILYTMPANLTVPNPNDTTTTFRNVVLEMNGGAVTFVVHPVPNNFFIQETVPTTSSVTSYWYQPSTNKSHRWDGSQWVVKPMCPIGYYTVISGVLGVITRYTPMKIATEQSTEKYVTDALSALVLPKVWPSDEVSIVTNTNIAHNLGLTPDQQIKAQFDLWFICKVAENGYAVGEAVLGLNTSWSAGYQLSDSNPQVTPAANTVSVVFSNLGTTAGRLSGFNKSGAQAYFNTANWRLRVVIHYE